MASACALPEPKGEVILLIDGMINECNQLMEVKLDRGMIDALPHQQVKTENPWDHGVQFRDAGMVADRRFKGGQGGFRGSSDQQ